MEAAIRVGCPENDPYICCFKSANEVLNLFYFNEAICTIANFPPNEHGGVWSARFGLENMSQISYQPSPKWQKMSRNL
jgi:hypothetical protein